MPNEQYNNEHHTPSLTVPNAVPIQGKNVSILKVFPEL